MNYRLASERDAPGIAQVKSSVWPDEPVDLGRLHSILGGGDHVTLVALSGAAIVGFADGFLTRAASGIRRWELDLLAVHPGYRGRGIATALVEHCTRAGLDRGAELARGLVHIRNTASQRAFEKNAYAASAAAHDLYLSSEPAEAHVETPPGLHLIAVETLNYRGLWLEGCWALDAFLAARSALMTPGHEVAGAVIPADDHAAIHAAEAAGYRRVGQYQWWSKGGAGG